MYELIMVLKSSKRDGRRIPLDLDAAFSPKIKIVNNILIMKELELAIINWIHKEGRINLVSCKLIIFKSRLLARFL